MAAATATPPPPLPARALVVVVASCGDRDAAAPSPPPQASLEVLHGGCAEAEARLLADPRALPDPLLWAWGPPSGPAAAAAHPTAPATPTAPTTVVLSQRWGPQVTHQAVMLPAGGADVRLLLNAGPGGRGGAATAPLPTATRHLLVCGSAATAAYLSALASEALPLWSRVARQAASCSVLWSGAGAWRVEHSTSSRAPPPEPPMPLPAAGAPAAPVAVPVVALRRADGALEGAVRLNLAAARVEVCPLRPRQPASLSSSEQQQPPAPHLLAAVPLARLLQPPQQGEDPSSPPPPLHAACAAIERLVAKAPPPQAPPPALAPALRALAEARARLQGWVDDAAALEREEEGEGGEEDEKAPPPAKNNNHITKGLAAQEATRWDRQERARTLLQQQAALQYGAEAALRRLARSLAPSAAAGGRLGSAGSNNSTPSAADLQMSAILAVDACATSSASTSLAWVLAQRAGQRPRAADGAAATAALAAALAPARSCAPAVRAAASAALSRRLLLASAGRTAADASEVVAMLGLSEELRRCCYGEEQDLEEEDWPLLQALSMALAAATRADAAPWRSSGGDERRSGAQRRAFAAASGDDDESVDVVTALHSAAEVATGGARQQWRGGNGVAGAAAASSAGAAPRGPKLDDVHSFPLALGGGGGGGGSSSESLSSSSVEASPVRGAGGRAAAASGDVAARPVVLPPLRLSALGSRSKDAAATAAAVPTSPFAAAAAVAVTVTTSPEAAAFWAGGAEEQYASRQPGLQQQPALPSADGPATAALRRLGQACGESAVACDLAAFAAMRQHARGEALTERARKHAGSSSSGGGGGGGSFAGALTRPLPPPQPALATAAVEDERALEALVEGIEDDDPEARPPPAMPVLCEEEDASGEEDEQRMMMMLPPGARARLALLSAIARLATRLAGGGGGGNGPSAPPSAIPVSPSAAHIIMDELLLPSWVLERRMLGGRGAETAAAHGAGTSKRLHPAVWWVRRRSMDALFALTCIPSSPPPPSLGGRGAAVVGVGPSTLPAPPPAAPSSSSSSNLAYDPVAARVRQRLLDYIAVRRPDASVFEACRELLLLLRDYLRARGGGGGGGGRPGTTAATGVLFAAADALARVEHLLRGAGPARHWPRHAVHLMDAHVQLLAGLMSAAAADAAVAVAAAEEAAMVIAADANAATAAAFVSISSSSSSTKKAAASSRRDSCCAQPGTLAAAYLLDLLGSSSSAGAGGGAGPAPPACTPRGSSSNSGAGPGGAPATPRVVPGATMLLVLEYLTQRLAAPDRRQQQRRGRGTRSSSSSAGGVGVGGSSVGGGSTYSSSSGSSNTAAAYALAPWADSESEEAAVRMRAWRLVAEAVAFCGRMQELDHGGGGGGGGSAWPRRAASIAARPPPPLQPGPSPWTLAAAGARLYRTIADSLFRPRAGGALPPFALAQLDALGALRSVVAVAAEAAAAAAGAEAADGDLPAGSDPAAFGLRGLPVQLRLLETVAAAFGPPSGGLGASLLMMAAAPAAVGAAVGATAAESPGGAAVAGDVASSVPDAYVTYHFLQFARLYRLLSLAAAEKDQEEEEEQQHGGGANAARVLAACKAHLAVLLAIAGATPLRDGALAGVFAAPSPPLFYSAAPPPGLPPAAASSFSSVSVPQGRRGRLPPATATALATASAAAAGGAVDGVARARGRFLRLHALEFLLRELSLEQDARRAVLPVAAAAASSRAASLASTPLASARGLSPRASCGGGGGSRRSSRGGGGLAAVAAAAAAAVAAAAAEAAMEDEKEEIAAGGGCAYRPGFDLEEDLERMLEEEGQEQEEEEGSSGAFDDDDQDDDGDAPLPGAVTAVPRLPGLNLGLAPAWPPEQQADEQGEEEEEEEEDDTTADHATDNDSGQCSSRSCSGTGEDGGSDAQQQQPRHHRWSVSSHAAAAAARVGPPIIPSAAALGQASAVAAAETLAAYRLQRRRHPLYRDPALHLGAAELLLALLPGAGAPAGIGAPAAVGAGSAAATASALAAAAAAPAARTLPPPPLCAAAAAASAQLDALLLPADAADTRLEAACAALRAHLSHPDNATLVSRLWQRAALAQAAVDRRRRCRAANCAGGGGIGGVEASAPLRRLLKLTAATLFEAAAACYRPGGEISRGQFGTIFAATRAFRGRTYHFALKCIDADSPSGGGAGGGAGGTAAAAGAGGNNNSSSNSATGGGAAVAAAAAVTACGGAGGAGAGGAGGAHTFERVHGEVAALEALAGVDGVVPLLEYGLLMPQGAGSNAPPSGPPRYCLVFPRYRCSLAAWRAEHGRGLPSEEREARRRVAAYLSLFEKVAAAVDQLHRAGVVHFDLKCDNVLCDPLPPTGCSTAASGGSASFLTSPSPSGDGARGGVAAGAASAAAWLRRGSSSSAGRARSAGGGGAGATAPSLWPLDPVPKKLVLADFGEAVVFGPAFTVGGGGEGEGEQEGEASGVGATTTTAAATYCPPTAAAAAAALALARRARGTELFSAPEVLLSEGGGAQGDRAHPAHDRRRHRGAGSGADVWSLGCALFQLLTGSVLFEADGHAAVARIVGMVAGGRGGGGGGAALAPPPPPPILSPREAALLDGHPALRDLVLFALVRDPRRRPTAADLRRRVARVMEEEYNCGSL